MFSDIKLQKCPVIFYRVKIRRIRGQEEECGSSFFDEYPCLLVLMEARIIQNDYISWIEFRTETFFYPGVENICIGTSLESHGSYYLVSPYSSKKSGSFIPISILFRTDRFSYRRPTSTFYFIVIHAAFIDIYDTSYFCDL